MKTIAFIIGIRPDIIRTSLIIEYLKKAKDIQTILIWSGQHYSDNLKTVFFNELKVNPADIELVCSGINDAEISSKLISELYPVLEKIKPDAVAFLGDTNTTLGSIAAAQLNIPIIHIEGCMRSYDWRMPEEKYRTISDHLADIIYAYTEEYKKLGTAEGLNPRNIVVVGNPIVDILNEFYFKREKYFDNLATSKFFSVRKIVDQQYYLMTCHRRENVELEKSFLAIMNLVTNANYPVYFPASYRTQKVIKKMKTKIPENLIVTDPVGYEEILLLMTHAKAVFTDSGTISEEACILNIPCINIRKSTERPEIYDVKSAVKFDPDQPEKYPPEIIFKKLQKISGTKWKHKFGDGKSSLRIANNIIKRLRAGKISGHLPQSSNLPIKRSYSEDRI